MIRVAIIAFLSIALAGCATAPRRAAACYYPAPARAEPAVISDVSIASPVKAYDASGNIYHTVRAGDTLWSISNSYNVDLDALISANSIRNRGAIEKGQVLVIPQVPKKTAATARPTAAKRVSFAWPVRGSIVSRFGDKNDSGVNKGIDIKASEGASVAASRPGRVVYCDSHLKGFGMTVIVDHLDGYQTVYSYNSDILVKVGDNVRQSQAIARVGQSGRATEPMLHFEIRKDGEPLDPARYL